MTKTEILQKDAPVLRKVAKSVPLKEIGGKKIKGLLEKMHTSLHAEEDGVALAAPQIGESLRLFIVRGDVLMLTKKRNLNVGPVPKLPQTTKDLVFINPEIIKTSRKKEKLEEGCLSIRWLYGQVKRADKVTLRAYNETGKLIERGASELLAQIFQHEIDHLNGVLFIDNAENVQDVPPKKAVTAVGGTPLKAVVKFVFFGSSQFSKYVLEELEVAGLSPVLNISSIKDIPSPDKLKKLDADVYVVASFGKILPKEILSLPKYGALNVHPSLLPKLRGASPIQETILAEEEAGVTIIKMDEKVDHGPILAQARVPITPWPDHYAVVEEKLARAGGRILGVLLPKWIEGEVKEIPQDEKKVSFTKLIKKEDGLLDLNESAEKNLRKVLAYSTWPTAYMFFRNKSGKEIRLVVKDAEIKDGKFVPVRVTPAGKREMGWQDFLRGN
ncbi:MAG: peptide deformylase [Patescibacteria group bacterium]